MRGPTSGVCDTCREDILDLIDRRAPDHWGIQMQLIANGHNTVPSWTRTHERRVDRINSIRDTCTRQGHISNANDS